MRAFNNLCRLPLAGVSEIEAAYGEDKAAEAAEEPGDHPPS
jgi:hypothetical protein